MWGQIYMDSWMVCPVVHASEKPPDLEAIRHPGQIAIMDFGAPDSCEVGSSWYWANGG